MNLRDHPHSVALFEAGLWSLIIKETEGVAEWLAGLMLLHRNPFDALSC